jgi:pimeloyl-ACP methyl ester carboxylesterase
MYLSGQEGVPLNFDEYSNLRRRITTPKGEFAYVEVGEGAPAVFVHGLFVSSYLWRHVFEELGEERRCIGYELPNHGGGHVPEEQPLSLEGLSECLESFVDALGLEGFDLVANDTGGAVAQMFAVRNPERVRTLTLTNCEARNVLPADHEDLARLAKELADKGELAPALITQLQDIDVARSDVGIGVGLKHPERLTEDDVRGYADPHLRTEESARGVERILAELAREQLVAIQPDVEKLKTPTLLVWGDEDPFFTMELAEWLWGNVVGVTELIEVQGGKLFWPGERPGELSPHLRRHWASRGEVSKAA